MGENNYLDLDEEIPITPSTSTPDNLDALDSSASEDNMSDAILSDGDDYLSDSDDNLSLCLRMESAEDVIP